MLKLFVAFFLVVLPIKRTHTQLCGNCEEENRGRCTTHKEFGYDCLGPEFHNSVILEALKLGMTPHTQLTGSKVPIFSKNMHKCFPEGFAFAPRR